MDENGKGMTQQDLDSLPEIEGVVLWQPDDDAPTTVIDLEGVGWFIGFYKGKLYKSRAH